MRLNSALSCRSAATGAAGAVATGARPAGSGIALAVGDTAAAEVVGADLHQHLVTGEQLNAELGELSGSPAEALVACGLLEGDQASLRP